MRIAEKTTLFITKKARKMFRNTWVHRLPITSWLYKRIFRIVFGNSEKTVDFRNGQFLLPTKDTSMVPSIINQDYESFELDIYESLLNKGDVVLDVGANLGIYSVIGARKVGKKGKVFAFEPVPENLKYLRQNVSANKADNVLIVPKGVGEKASKQKIYIAKDNVGTHSMGKRSSSKYITVEVTSIDDYVKKLGLTVDFIKMDIEGYEGHAIRGASKTLKHVTLLTEFTASRLRSCGDDPEAIARQLMKMFKNCYIIDERTETLQKADKLKDVAKLENSNILFANKEIKLKRTSVLNQATS